MAAQLIPLRTWAETLFGEHVPHRHTLRNWVNGGKIRPMPIKVGRSYFCRPDAKYVDPIADEINRMTNGSKAA
ncbi:excisionase [Paraburkholderia sp. D15]|uniref:excisionase n=1 Tax=Paraburkholderia sp. D15 TaxID=2880218 RepID=UPI0024784EED|nr:excisionase [Paraburkholderia sp. D15]WGS53519.1 excisionase [Paraburkholderia sp. D15]